MKTRVIPVLGEAAAAEFYRLLAEQAVRQTEPAGGDYERLFFFAPEAARGEMEAWFPGETWIAQQGVDLGERMAAAFEECFRRGARRVAIIGSDVPSLSRATVSEALRALEDHDVVIGPARDGGYYLIALAAPIPALFQGIAWSTSSVLAVTLERAGVLGLTVRLLETLRDIDTIDDIRAAWPDLQPLLVGSPLLEELQAALS